MPLVLTRGKGDTITVGVGEVAVDVTVADISAIVDEDTGHVYGESVRLAFDSVADVPVWRREIAADRIIGNALKLALEYGGVDGAAHRQWVIDQMVRLLAGSKYAEVVPEGWDAGVAP